ncbi:TetR/AcrR family transcriptional regulator [Mammaliicoccus sciuri]|uniref:TetR/AcrR family transcriptional regulator n=1 Tax=Mammaliicoccus sciuri TaxID=1296 RepID=A0AB37HH86_MAMSC|nr:TetR/AcrR family transcriptional regulator [Mammaliicoccus sciuri]MCD8835726.1 TetR/AcrR family transcriptional regulator [Mammaliicoccus sciuri]MCJ0939321.1 TetR/AcrR family transcriptional regulator [Mammaliicoccus sciuri]MCJ0964468.1 TetR/AcrR family transcriptional regulator [Mammaliicoccus sciuri]QRN90146.1 TetR/AcrR family transcriptional regulator [Mammaliicoccus sciuri]
MRRDAEENKNRIETKAKALFNEFGVENISMKRISNELNIGMGTLYRHFEDKSALCYKLISNDFEMFMSDLKTISQKEHSNKMIFIQSIDRFLQFKMEHQALLKCVENSTSKKDFKQTEFYQLLHDYYSNLFNYEENKHFITFKVDILLNALTTKNYEFLTENRKMSNEELRNALVQLFYNDYQGDDEQ